MEGNKEEDEEEGKESERREFDAKSEGRDESVDQPVGDYYRSRRGWPASRLEPPHSEEAHAVNELGAFVA